jgi:hypothetical protein
MKKSELSLIFGVQTAKIRASQSVEDIAAALTSIADAALAVAADESNSPYDRAMARGLAQDMITCAANKERPSA